MAHFTKTISLPEELKPLLKKIPNISRVCADALFKALGATQSTVEERVKRLERDVKKIKGVKK